MADDINNQESVIVYSTPTCPICKQVKDFLNAKNIEFEDINVAENAEKAKEIAEKTGQMSVPVIQIGNNLLVGFDKEKLKEALNIEE